MPDLSFLAPILGAFPLDEPWTFSVSPGLAVLGLLALALWLLHGPNSGRSREQRPGRAKDQGRRARGRRTAN